MILVKRRLEELVDFNYGKGLPERERIDGDFPVYGSGGIGGYHKEALVKGPGIIVGRKGSVGTVYFEKKDFFPIDTVYFVTAKDESVDLRYLYYLLKTLPLNQLNTHAAVPGLNRKVALNQEVSFFELESTRDRVLDVLEKYDNLIENNIRRIELLEESVRLLYREWFVHLRFPGYEHTKIIKGVPEGWDRLTFEDILNELESGNRPKGGAVEEGIPSVGAENVIGIGRYNYSKDKYVPERFFEGMNRGIVNNRDVLLYKDGANIGRVSYFGDGFPHDKCAINEHVFILRTNEKCSQSYLYFWLDRPEGNQVIKNLNASAAQPGVNQTKLKGVKLIVPSHQVLNIFDEYVEPIIKKIFILAIQNRKLKEARDILLPRLMNGDIAV